MPFVSTFGGVVPEDSDFFVYSFNSSDIAVICTGEYAEVPRFQVSSFTDEQIKRLHYIGSIDTTPCFAGAVKDLPAICEMGATVKPLRSIASLLPPDQLHGALSAIHIVNCDLTTRFCGRCGQPTRFSNFERAKICTVCEYTSFPKISPAMIVAVIKNQQILLGHASRFPNVMYSVIAGFVDPGETLEACVAREVHEETGISVKNICYFGSQPWPFPDSLMIAFTAEYAGGEICVDGKELTDAAWFSADALPTIPDRISIARQLIDWFTEKHG